MGKTHRDRTAQNRVVAFSVSYQRAHLLARGLGLEHLKELVQRLARSLVRKCASIAYAGSYSETREDNFTYLLLRLISAEQEDNSLGGPDTSNAIGGLINHSVWPHLLEITPRIEAQWINCCRIVRITQEAAGIAPDDIVHDAEKDRGSDRYLLNGAIALTRMRQVVMQGTTVHIPDAPADVILPISARIALGGKLEGYRGFVPGIFQEALATLEGDAPLYVLGGFGGAAATIANAFLSPVRPPELTADWHRERTPDLVKLEAEWARRPPPPYVRSTEALLDALWERTQRGIASLHTGLDDAQTTALLTSCDINLAVQLVKQGLANRLGIWFDDT